jgi:hypothetical protein
MHARIRCLNRIVLIMHRACGAGQIPDLVDF